MSDAKIESWRDLVVWQKAHVATIDVYRLTQSFPSDERYRLTNQLCRAAASVTTNIAEGKGRGSIAEFCQFLVIARGSIEEDPLSSAARSRSRVSKSGQLRIDRSQLH
jgi:four helix bundle protein